MAITTRAGLVAALTQSSECGMITKSAFSVSTGRTYSLFRATGLPVGGSTPSTSGAALDRTTAGAITVPAGGVTYWTGGYIASTVANMYVLYDRLVETGGLSGTTTTAQTVSSASLPSRNTTGAGTELWLEVYSALGVTPSATVTASYTNQAGVAGQTATLNGGIPASLAANTCVQLALAVGDTGVQSVQSVTSTTSTGTAGSFGIVIRQPIGPALFPNTNLGYVDVWLSTIPTDACLELLTYANGSGSTSGTIQGSIRTAQG